MRQGQKNLVYPFLFFKLYGYLMVEHLLIFVSGNISSQIR